MTEQDRAAVAALSALFREHVDVKQLLADLEGATARPSEWAADPHHKTTQMFLKTVTAR